MITISKRGRIVPFTDFLFPGGEVSVKLDMIAVNDNVPYLITARIHDSNDIMRLLLLTDALRRADPCPIHLFIPYIPYGRQDRICNVGEAHSLKVFASLINAQGYERVITVDPHSDVTGALFDRLEIKTVIDVFNSAPAEAMRKVFRGVALVSPDAGANKKVGALASCLYAEFIRADKLRDLKTGRIKETVVYMDDLTGGDVAIVDDICDGGASFTTLAKVLKTKGARRVLLYVTHGIFSKGLKPLIDAGIDDIYTTNSYTTSTGDLKALSLEDVFNLN